MNLELFADIINEEIILLYYPNQNKRWCAHFKDCEIKDGAILTSAFEDGETPEQALAKYEQRIRGCKLVFRANQSTRKEFVYPQAK